MNESSLLSPMLQQLLMQSPIILVSLVGLILVFSQAPRLGKAALLAKFGTGLSFLLSLASPIIQMTMMRNMAISGSTFDAKMMGIVSVFVNVLWAAATFLIIIAVITDRPAIKAPPTE